MLAELAWHRGITAPCEKDPVRRVFNRSANVGLGPEIPLPLVQQLPDEEGYGTILSQPTDLVPLSANMLNFFKETTTKWRNDPFFAYVAHPHVHTATANIDELGQYKQYVGCPFANTTLRGGYGDALAEVDWMFGEMVKHIEALQLQSNTLFLFVSDNGPALRQELGVGQLAHSVPITHRIVMLVKVQHGRVASECLRLPTGLDK